MKNSIFTIAALLVFFSLYQIQLQAQDRWNVEFRTGIDFSAGDIADVNPGAGFGFETAAAYRFMPHFAAYTGWSWNHFGTDQSFAGTDASFEETGYTFGFQFIHPIGDSEINYLIRLGGTFNHIEIENNKGDIISDSGHGLGWQAEAGIVIGLSDNISLIPGIRYRSLSRNINIDNVSNTIEMNYFSVGAGFSWSL